MFTCISSAATQDKCNCKKYFSWHKYITNCSSVCNPACLAQQQSVCWWPSLFWVGPCNQWLTMVFWSAALKKCAPGAASSVHQGYRWLNYNKDFVMLSHSVSRKQRAPLYRPCCTQYAALPLSPSFAVGRHAPGQALVMQIGNDIVRLIPLAVCIIPHGLR